MGNTESVPERATAVAAKKAGELGSRPRPAVGATKIRKLIVAEFMSLDGVVEAPDKWHFPYVNEEFLPAQLQTMADVDTMLLGRVTYQSFAGAFKDAAPENPIAAMMNRPAKVVVSETLGHLDWQNSTLLTGDIPVEVARLKAQVGGDIMVIGSTRLARTLLSAGLVDELDLLIHPIVVGTGQRLFEDNGVSMPLVLTSCATFKTGVIHAVYHRA